MNRIYDYILSWKQSNGGKPFCAFLYDLQQLKAHATRTIASLPPGYRYFYAIKANSEARILQTLASVVYGFEVASLGEVCKVREVAPVIPIIFGGPGKTDEELEGAIHHRVSLLHVESIHELLRVEEIARRKGQTIDILLRVNLRGPLPEGTLQMAGVSTQFGIDEQDIPNAISLAKKCSYIKLQGFHFHSLSNNLNAEQHSVMLDYYIERVRQWQAMYDLEVRYINAGGGIGINYENTGQPFDWHTFTRKLGKKRTEAVSFEMLFECGRYTVASCGYYAAEVLDVKRVGGDFFAVVNGGLHHFLLPGAWKHCHPFEVVPIEAWHYPFPRLGLHNSKATIVGRMDSPRDILVRDAVVPSLRIGDVVLFPYAGAYGWSISANSYSSLEHPEFVFIG
jgi:diaminopimelate decarboxylase